MSVETELAWAAGFFDGEGTTYSPKANKIVLSLPQKTKECLYRFQAAVECGKVMGPYFPPSQPKGYSMCHWTCQKGADCFSVLHKLWPYLSNAKKEQAIRAGFTFGGEYCPKKHGPKRAVPREEFLKHNHLKAKEIAEMFGISVWTVNHYRAKEAKLASTGV